MAATVRIDGAEKFARTARALKKAGAKDLRRELYRILKQGHALGAA